MKFGYYCLLKLIIMLAVVNAIVIPLSVLVYFFAPGAWLLWLVDACLIAFIISWFWDNIWDSLLTVIRPRRS